MKIFPGAELSAAFLSTQTRSALTLTGLMFFVTCSSCSFPNRPIALVARGFGVPSEQFALQSGDPTDALAALSI
eukprot:4955913-Amphidinium_carterae.1